MGSQRGRPGSFKPVALVALLLSWTPGAVAARERPPLPDPLPCPLDAPLRVASEDTVKRFTALEDCASDRIVIAPLVEPRPARAPVEIEPFPAASARMASAKKRKGRIGDTSVERAELGEAGTEVVRIVPVLPDPPAEMPAVILAPGAPVQVGGPVSGSLLDAAAPADSVILGSRPAGYTSPYDALIADAAVRHRVDPLMLHSVIKQESGYRPLAVSRAGARGLMQIMPGTGRDLGVADPGRLADPAVNIDAGARLLRKLWTRFDGRFDLVLAAYNAGEGAVRRFGMRVPPFAETQHYVTRVQDIYLGLATGVGLIRAR
jgi:hypothetical protein